MKNKFSSMWRVGIALVMVLSLGLVTATPVAATVGTPMVEVDPTTASATDAEYTITFTTTVDLSTAVPDEIYIEFPSETTTVPTTYVAGAITVNGGDVADASGEEKMVTISVPANVPAGTVTVVFKAAAEIDNPSIADDYTLAVSTSKEVTPVPSSPYTITLEPPTIDDAATGPDAANQGETLDVYIKGTDFVEGATSVSFSGTGITVDEVSVVDEDEVAVDYLIATITIAPDAAKTARDVTVTTTAGDSDPVTFTVKEAETELVDGYTTPTGDLLDAGWLDYVGSSTIDIQDAIDNIVADTLLVHAATYTEQVVIDKDITLESYMGADSTIIDGGTAVQIVSVTAGATIDGFTIQGDATTLNQSGLLVNGLDVNEFAIQNNKFVDIANDNLKVWSFAGAITDGLIDNNTLTGLGADAQGACILVESSGTNTIAGIEITDNTISNFLGVEYEWPGIQVSENINADISNITITGNNISNGATGIKLWGDIDGLTVANGYAIADNTISGMFEGGVSTDGPEGARSPVFDLVNNSITSCKYGIDLFESAADHTIKYNDISGNSWGLLAPSTIGTITAKYNWWGDISGPSSGSQLPPTESWWSEKVSTALGSGDAMSINVDTWDPWLTRDQDTAISDGIAYHGSIYPLEAGWNTLSVPLALDDDADTLSDIVALGDFIISDPTDLNRNYLGGYYYDAVNGLWVELPGAYEFAPCAAVYVNMAEDASFPVLYSGVFSLPSLSLPDGWNLIGSAFGINKGIIGGDDYGIAVWDDTDNDGAKAVDVALASLGASCTVVISPSMPGQEVAWATVATDKTIDMLVGEGYWVFLTAPATLAGFEVTPLYKIFLP